MTQPWHNFSHYEKNELVIQVFLFAKYWIFSCVEFLR